MVLVIAIIEFWKFSGRNSSARSGMFIAPASNTHPKLR